MTAPTTNPESLSQDLSVEDTGDGFFIIVKGNGHDLTLSLDDDVAVRLAAFIASRRREGT